MITALVFLGWMCLVAGGVLVFRDSRARRRERKAAKALSPDFPVRRLGALGNPG